jgi:hypothetical protein
MKIKTKWVVGAVLTGLLAVVYYLFDPAVYPFPKCPLLVWTGIKCPGCGSQRAVHHLLHLDMEGAMRENLLLVLSVPYLILGYTLQWTQIWPDVRSRLYGYQAARVVFVVVVVFWVWRNWGGGYLNFLLVF